MTNNTLIDGPRNNATDLGLKAGTEVSMIGFTLKGSPYEAPYGLVYEGENDCGGSVFSSNGEKYTADKNKLFWHNNMVIAKNVMVMV